MKTNRENRRSRNKPRKTIDAVPEAALGGRVRGVVARDGVEAEAGVGVEVELKAGVKAEGRVGMRVVSFDGAPPTSVSVPNVTPLFHTVGGSRVRTRGVPSAGRS